jgi:hypothetical protein
MRGLRMGLVLSAPAGLHVLGVATMLATDTLVGDGVFLHGVKFESARAAFAGILRDLVSGLPVAYALTLAAAGFGVLLRRTAGHAGWWMPLAGAIGGAITGAHLCIVPSVEVLLPAVGFGAVAGYVCDWLSATASRACQGASA